MNSTYFTRFEEKKVIVIDYGKGTASYYNAFENETYKKLKPSEVLDLPSKYPGYIFISEDAHLGIPQNEQSMAQMYTPRKLSKFYQNCSDNDVILKFFPQKLSPRASLYVGMPKSDDNDPFIIYEFLKHHPEIKLKNPRLDFSITKLQQEGYRFKFACNKKTNGIRMDGEDKQSYSKEDLLPKFIIENLDYLDQILSDEAKDAFGLTVEKDLQKNKKPITKILSNGREVREFKTTISKYTQNRKTKKGQCIKGEWKINNIKMPQLCSILAPLYGVREYDELQDTHVWRDKLNIRSETGELPEWKFVKQYVFEFKPFHQKGGVARSNLTHFGQKSYVQRKAKRYEGLDLKRKIQHPFKIKDGKPELVTVSVGSFANEETQVFKKYRKTYQDCTREVFRVFRNLLLERYSL